MSSSQIVPATTGRRALKKLQTREALSQAALQLFQRRGFDAVTIDDITADAGVSRRTFFRYFSSKEAVFFAPQEARLVSFEARISATTPSGQTDPLATGALDRVMAGVLEMADLYQTQREEVLATHRVLSAARGLAAWDQQLDSRWETAIVDALRPEFGELHAVVFAGAIIGTVRAGLRRWFAADAGFDLVDFGLQAFATLATGLPVAPPPTSTSPL